MPDAILIDPDRTYVVIDIETTGLMPPEGRIIEFAGIRICEGRCTETFSTLINPDGVKIHWFVRRMTGIKDHMLRTAPRFTDVASEIARFIDGACIVAHNASFDYGFVKHQLEQSIEGYVMENEKLCTVKMTRRRYPQLGKYNLDFLTENLGLTNPRRHRAMGDAVATAELFLKYHLHGVQPLDVALPAHA